MGLFGKSKKEPNHQDEKNIREKIGKLIRHIIVNRGINISSSSYHEKKRKITWSKDFTGNKEATYRDETWELHETERMGIEDDTPHVERQEHRKIEHR